MTASQKVLQDAIVAALRESGGLSKAALRDVVAADLDLPIGMPELAAAIQSLRYAGKLRWEHLELSDSMKLDGVPAPATEGGAADRGPADTVKVPPSIPSVAGGGPDDDDDYPGNVNDVGEADADASSAEGGAAASTPENYVPPAPAAPETPPSNLAALRTSVGGPSDPTGAAARGRHASNTRAASRPVPPPVHESEVQRAVRESATENVDRRRLARSTGSVSTPLELRRMLLPDPTLAEAIQTAFAQEPHDLVTTINRKHPLLWKRIIALGRATGKRPAAALYDVIEAGLSALEQGELSDVA